MKYYLSYPVLLPVIHLQFIKSLFQIGDLYHCRGVPDGDLVARPWTAHGYKADPPLNFKKTLQLEEVNSELNGSNSNHDTMFGLRGTSPL